MYVVGIPNRTSYAASKFAVQGYCEPLRAELASSGVSVHVISPGYIRTNLSRSAMLGDGRLYAKMGTTTDNGADPQDVAATILEQVSKGKTDLVVAATFSS
jgi:dehydrogenase/reductase SDR family protein 7B